MITVSSLGVIKTAGFVFSFSFSFVHVIVKIFIIIFITVIMCYQRLVK